MLTFLQLSTQSETNAFRCDSPLVSLFDVSYRFCVL